METSIKATDMLGRTIQVGDTISYPVRRGSAMWNNKIVVTEIGTDGDAVVLHGLSADRRSVKLKNLKYVVVPPSPAIDLAVGRRLIYNVRRGSKMWRNILTVTMIDGDVYGRSTEGRPVKVSNLADTIVIV